MLDDSWLPIDTLVRHVAGLGFVTEWLGLAMAVVVVTVTVTVAVVLGEARLVTVWLWLASAEVVVLGVAGLWLAVILTVVLFMNYDWRRTNRNGVVMVFIVANWWMVMVDRVAVRLMVVVVLLFATLATSTTLAAATTFATSTTLAAAATLATSTTLASSFTMIIMSLIILVLDDD